MSFKDGYLEPLFLPVRAISLNSLLRKKGGLQPNNVILVVAQLLDILQFLNEKGYCYGPFSCSDIFV
jgi:hypothetical protein